MDAGRFGRASVLVVAALCVSKASAAVDPNVVPKYKVGDHVEFSSNGACLGEQFALPTQGTIIQVNLETMSYIIKVDSGARGSAGTNSKPIYTQDCGFRPLEGAAPQGAAAPPPMNPPPAMMQPPPPNAPPPGQ